MYETLLVIAPPHPRMLTALARSGSFKTSSEIPLKEESAATI